LKAQHVEPSMNGGITNSITRLHLVGYFYWVKRCNVASCWIYIRILLRCTDPWTLKKSCIHILSKVITYFQNEFLFYKLKKHENYRYRYPQVDNVLNWRQVFQAMHARIWENGFWTDTSTTPMRGFWQEQSSKPVVSVYSGNNKCPPCAHRNWILSGNCQAHYTQLPQNAFRFRAFFLGSFVSRRTVLVKAESSHILQCT